MDGDGELGDALAFVASHPHVYLLGRRSDGFPTGWAMTARVDGASVLFSTYAKSAKVAHLLREGRARVLATDDEEVVEIAGTVQLADAERWLVAPAVSGAGLGPVPETVTDGVRAAHRSGKRVVLELVAERSRTTRMLA